MFKVTHPKYGSKRVFSSWMELCDATVSIAMASLEEQFDAMVTELSDEMISTAEEYEPQEA